MLEKKKLGNQILSLEETVRKQLIDIGNVDLLQTALQESEANNAKLAGEINHLQQKADSVSRDLKKVMRDDAMTLSEFEKALVRKSEECNVSNLK